MKDFFIKDVEKVVQIDDAMFNASSPAVTVGDVTYSLSQAVSSTTGQKEFDAIAAYLADVTSLADDTMVEFTPPSEQGIAIVYTKDDTLGATAALLSYKSTATAYIFNIAGSADVAVATTELTTGTSDGVDAKLNVHVYGDKVQVKNRLGSTLSFGIIFKQ